MFCPSCKHENHGFSRFVGRVDEMAALEAALARAIAGNAQVVGIVGEPGVGKRRSRAMGGTGYRPRRSASPQAPPVLTIHPNQLDGRAADPRIRRQSCARHWHWLSSASWSRWLRR
jgi:hypothetical protein